MIVVQLKIVGKDEKEQQQFDNEIQASAWVAMQEQEENVEEIKSYNELGQVVYYENTAMLKRILIDQMRNRRIN